MINYLVKIFITILFSAFIAFFYYSINPAHVINFDGYIGYLLPLAIIYSIYKYFTITSGNKVVSFSLYGILGYFLLNLFLLCLFFFGMSGGADYSSSTGIILFFKIIIFSILPIVIVFLSISFGKKLLKIGNIIKEENKENTIFNFLISLGLGFFSFLFLLTVIGLSGIYNLYSVGLVLLFFIIISIDEIKDLYAGFLSYRVTFENHDFKDDSLIKNIALKLLSTEFLFILASIILAINLISIVRPMPIGWDDLGVYMNYPRQMAHSGMIDFLGGMYSWQVFTGIGFMVFEPVQAFFLNNVGSFLSFIVIILVVSDLLGESKIEKLKTKTLINIPLLLATIFISMPMVVFQQAKDMKLDEGLFFVSVIVFYLVAKILIPLSNSLLKEKEQGQIKLKDNISTPLLEERLGEDYKNVTLKILFVIGILAGFAFSIKFTSLLLISAIIGILFYTEIGFFGFLGYLGIYFSIFTKAGLWSYLNVIYPKENVELINSFSYISFVIGVILIFVGFLRHKKEVLNLFKYVGIFILGILLAISPWIGKNLIQANSNNTEISLGVLLLGKTDSLKIDYTKIHTDDELYSIEKIDKEKKLNNPGSTNEDFGRYIGYEKGINNYVKLPWNLTMQVNQGGEFTTLGWLFLALIPILFIFLKYRRKGIEYFVLLFVLGEILLFIIPSSSQVITNILSQINLPFGYIVLFSICVIPVLFLLFGLKNNRLNNLFKINLVFSFFYIFLFVISAFGIVWYGIVMYFSLLLMMGISLYYLSSYLDNDPEKKKDIKLFGSFIVFMIFVMYFFLSIFPYSFNNLKNAGYPHFKSGNLSSTEAVFAYHPEYQTILSTLNIDKNKYDEILNLVLNIEETNDKIIYNLITSNKLDLNGSIDFLNKLERGFLDKQFEKIIKNKKELISLKLKAKEIRIKLLNIILKPNVEFSNTGSIYRIGTFLKYFINGNNKRLMEDSLVSHFDKYIYSDKGVDETVKNIKGLGLKYFLVDLNAATIDNDPRHDLTRRYENLLKTFTSDKLKLIETDSICLKLALEDYSKSQKSDKDLANYMILAGVNYTGYTDDNKVIPRNSKMKACENRINQLSKENKITNKNYSYLMGIKSLNHGYKVLFEVK